MLHLFYFLFKKMVIHPIWLTSSPSILLVLIKLIFIVHFFRPIFYLKISLIEALKVASRAQGPWMTPWITIDNLFYLWVKWHYRNKCSTNSKLYLQRARHLEPCCFIFCKMSHVSTLLSKIVHIKNFTFVGHFSMNMSNCSRFFNYPQQITSHQVIKTQVKLD